MNFNNKPRLSLKLLVIYMISALLFLTSSELHIHTKDSAPLQDHGAAVSVSSLSGELDTAGAVDEIKVSPDGIVKVNPSSPGILAVFLVLLLLIVSPCRTCVARLRDHGSRLPGLPFFGTPPLRAPPAIS